jgi:hypothetical protein
VVMGVVRVQGQGVGIDRVLSYTRRVLWQGLGARVGLASTWGGVGE